MKPYADRCQAGQVLAKRVRLTESTAPIVLALPRGGVPVAAEVAAVLGAPLDVIVVRKIGFLDNRELAMGAIATVAGNVETVTNSGTMARLDWLGRSHEEFAEVAERERRELGLRDRLYRGDRPPADLCGRTAIVVDDGVATGASMRAAVAAVRLSGSTQIVIAVPVCLPGALSVLEEIADEVVCPWIPEHFMAVGQAYQRFDQVPDDDVRAILGIGSGASR
ncbi:MAG: phosphoribosyltransferase family protein [Aeromicrobium sp.]